MAGQTVWRAVGNPGVVLVDAETVVTWRPGIRSGRVTLLRDEARVVGTVLGARGQVEVGSR